MLTVEQLAGRIGAELVGNGAGKVTAVGPVETSSPTDVTFVTDEKHTDLLKKSQAGAVIINKPLKNLTKPQLVVKDVNAALIETLGIFAPKLKPPKEGIDPSAVVADDVRIGHGTAIGAHVVLRDGVRIGKNCVIGPGCKVGQNSTVGDDCRLDGNVVIYHNCEIGDHVFVQANTTIGSTGFGYTFIDGAHRLIPHNGGVIIEDFVGIGANCCIDRAKFGNTVIGAGTKIDNLVQIAHNVRIGKCCLIVGQVGIAGSSTLGDGVVLAGQVGIVDNVNVGDGVIIGAQAGVTRDIPAGKKVLGAPAIDYAEEVRLLALRARLPKMAEQIKQLQKRLERLEGAEDHKNRG